MTKELDPYHHKKQSCNAFLQWYEQRFTQASTLKDDGTRTYPTEALLKALAIIWSSTTNPREPLS